jgi:hypothetical protein
VDAVTDAVGGAADGATGTIDDVADGAAGAVGGAADGASDAVGGATGDVAGGGSATGDGSGAGAPPTTDPTAPGDPSPRTVQPRPDVRSSTWHRIPTPMDRGFGPVELGPAPALAPDLVAAGGSHLRALAAEDPCVTDPSLVCLGLLFGIGDFNGVAAEVLGSLALTGARILLALAAAGVLLLLGSISLGLSRRLGSRPVAGTG